MVRPLLAISAYHERLFSIRSARPHNAKWTACHQCISKCGLPYQLLKVSPVSCGGSLPAHCTLVRYCESTTRRSNSLALGSVLPAKSMAEPRDQNASQPLLLLVAVAAKSGIAAASPASGLNNPISSNTSRLAFGRSEEH